MGFQMILLYYPSTPMHIKLCFINVRSKKNSRYLFSVFSCSAYMVAIFFEGRKFKLSIIYITEFNGTRQGIEIKYEKCLSISAGSNRRNPICRTSRLTLHQWSLDATDSYHIFHEVGIVRMLCK